MTHWPDHWKKALIHGGLLILILLAASYLRLTGLNWDQGQWIHPDEGHMRMVLSSIGVPDSLSLYFDTHRSPLNPRNNGQIYSYGTLPMFVTRLAAEWLDRGCGESPNGLSQAVGSLLLDGGEPACRPGTFTGSRGAQVGRLLSALSDLGTVLLVYLIGRRLYGPTAGLLAMGLSALTAFSIQQAHFFTVDSMACLFTSLTTYFAVRAGQSSPERPSWLDFGLGGLASGLATACKVSGALAALLVALAGLWWWIRAAQANPARPLLAWLVPLLPRILLAGILSLLAFRVAQPYAFEGPGFLGLQPSPEWFDRLEQIRHEQSGAVDLPPGRQWTDRPPLLFPWLNMVVWGLGLPLGLIAWAGWGLAGVELFRGKGQHLVLWTWASLVFLYHGTSWVKSMRYFLALYPLFAILGASFLIRLSRSASKRRRRLGLGLAAGVLVGTALWAWAVFSIYLRPHPRIAASHWILDNVPAGSTVANEHWDWGLPLPVDGKAPFRGSYTGIEMQNYNEDTPAKREQLFGWLDEADYIFMASNRLYASISRLPARYPLTTAYYRALFAGELGFELAADFTSRPALWPFQFPDQEIPYPLMEAEYVWQREPIQAPLPPAEEAFSVYDHPRVLIFRKTPAYSRQRVEQILGPVDLGQAQIGLKPIEASPALYHPDVAGKALAGLVLVSLVGLAVYKFRPKFGSAEKPDNSPPRHKGRQEI